MDFYRQFIFQDITEQPDLTGWIIARTDMVPGGERDSVTFEAPSEPGEYVYVCTFPGHYAGGMKGILVIK